MEQSVMFLLEGGWEVRFEKQNQELDGGGVKVSKGEAKNVEESNRIQEE